MKRKIFGIPVIVVAILIAVLAGGAAYGIWQILTISGDVTVLEAITVDPDMFSLEMYPGETLVQQIEVTNASTAELTVGLLSSIDPAPVPPAGGVELTVPASVVVPGESTALVDVSMFAQPDAQPQEYTITIDVSR